MKQRLDLQWQQGGSSSSQGKYVTKVYSKVAGSGCQRGQIGACLGYKPRVKATAEGSLSYVLVAGLSL